MRFLLWAAVSSGPQLEGDSLGEQLAVARALVDSLDDAHITGELTVPGKSRSIVLFEDAAREIPAYAELKTLCQRRAFDVLVCRSLDRLGRTSALITTVEALVEEAGAIVYELDNPRPLGDQRPHDDSQLYISAFRSANAQAEVRRFQRHREFGMRARIRRGQAPGRVPYGYRKVGTQRDSQAVIAPEEAEVVRQIFALYLRGWGMTRICNHLNEKGIPSAEGKLWDRGTMYGVLHNPFYAGYVTWGRSRDSDGERFIAGGQHEGLLDAETWRQVEQERERRKRLHSRGQSSARPFTGAVWCKRCGKPMNSIGSGRPRKDGSRKMSPGYCCQTYVTSRCRKGVARACHSNYVRDEKIRAEIGKEQARIRQIGADVAAAERMQQRAVPSPDQIAAVEKQLAALDAERKRLVVAYTRGQSLTVEEFEAAISDVEKRRHSAEAQLTDLKRAAESDTLADVTARLQSLATLNLDGDPQEVRATLAKALRLWCEEREIVAVELL